MGFHGDRYDEIIFLDVNDGDVEMTIKQGDRECSSEISEPLLLGLNDTKV